MRAKKMRMVMAAMAAMVLAMMAQRQQATAASAADDVKPKEEGFVAMFDGKTLDGWEGNPEFWSVKDGALCGETTKDHMVKSNTFLIWKKATPGDFEIRCNFKLEGGNSGIQYRSKILDEKNWVVGGYQADMDGDNTYTGILYEERMSRGIMTQRGESTTYSADGKKKAEKFADAKELAKSIHTGDWNEYIVIAKGNTFTHFINGVKMSEVVDNDPKKSRADGVIALQLHAGFVMKVQFKDLRIRIDDKK